MSPSRRGSDSDPGGVDGGDATGLRDRVARGLLAAPRDAEARPKVKARRPLGRAADAAQKDRGGRGRLRRPPPRKTSTVSCALRSPTQSDRLALFFGRRAATWAANDGPRQAARLATQRRQCRVSTSRTLVS